MLTKVRVTLRKPVVLVPLGAVATLGLLVLLLGPVAYWSTAAMAELTGKERADALTATRQILLAAAAGVAALAGLAYTARNYHLSRRGQLTDRFGKAITQLASDKLTERLGGIYALENLMVESERDHDTVVEVLAAFIRDRTAEPTHDHEAEVPDYRSLATDVQAALTVLGRRPERHERNSVDLRSTDICGADLSGLRLDGVNLWRAKLRNTIAHGVRLVDANLSWADVRDSRFGHAELTNASLYGTLLADVTLGGAQLEGVRLNEVRQLAAARIDDDTVLSPDLRRELLHHHRQRLHRALVVHLEERQL